MKKPKMINGELCIPLPFKDGSPKDRMWKLLVHQRDWGFEQAEVFVNILSDIVKTGAHEHKP